MERSLTKILLTIAGLTIFTFLILFTLYNKEINPKFSEQSYSFLQGRLDITGGGDTAYFQGKYYWPQGPFPSLPIMPFMLLFGPNFTQAEMQFILIPLLLYLAYKLARIQKFNKTDSLFLMYGFTFGSFVVGLMVDAGNVYYAQIVDLILLLILLIEFCGKRRFLILGFLTAALIATRPTSSLIILFLLFSLINENKKRVQNLILFLAPITLAIIILLILNQLRFGNPFDNGYYTNDVGGPLGAMRDDGIFSISHILTNFYYYFIPTLRAVTNESMQLVFPFVTYNPWGISFLLTSPIFLYAFKSIFRKDTLIRSLWFISSITLLCILMYYAPGWVQFGPRYMADFLPLLYLILLLSLKGNNLTSVQKTIIISSGVLNTYLIFSRYYLSLFDLFQLY